MATITQLRNKQYAAWFFGGQSPGQYMYAVPRYKFMFYANFIVNSQAATLYPWLMQLGGTNGISFKIRTIEKPNVELQQKELNQYNRKRYAYTKTDYRPLNISIYDTVDNTTLDLWRQYFTYYFGDARQKSPMVMDQSTVSPTFEDSTGWGLRPLGEQTNFFSQLDLYAIWGLRYTRVSYLNPKIMNVNWNSYDTASSEMADMSMSLSYETLRYEPSAAITPGIAALFGFDVGPPAVEPDVGLSGTILESATGIVDNMYAQAALNNTPGGGLLSVAASVVANFGLAMTSYNAFTRTGYGPYNGQATQTAIPQAITFSSALSAYDNVQANTPISGYYSDVTGTSEPILAGLPDGQLPSNTGQITAAVSTFATAENQRTSTIGNYGSHNFGSGGFDPGVPNYGAGPSVGSNQQGVPNERAYAYQGPYAENQWAALSRPDYRYGGFEEATFDDLAANALSPSAMPGGGTTQSTQSWPGVYSRSPGGDPRIPGYQPSQVGSETDIGAFSVTGGNTPNNGFSKVSGNPGVRGYATTRGGSSAIPQSPSKPLTSNNRKGIPHVPPAR